jgi:hypothetical protein
LPLLEAELRGMAGKGPRVITLGELALAKETFGANLPYAQLRLIDGANGNPAAMAAFKNGNTAITLRRSIYFGPHYRPDFSAAEPHARGLFLHEMTHVWQYARLGVVRFGVRYARDMVSCRFKASRMYDYQPGVTRFPSARLEAQAQMVGDYCEAKLAGNAERIRLIAASLKDSGIYGL